MSYRLYEDPTRIAGVRRYLPGDPLNRIHWKATAATGVLQSKVVEPSSVAGITILLDLHQTAFPAGDEPVRSDLAVTAAASLANAVFEMGQQVGLITNARDAATRIRHEGWSPEFKSRGAARSAASMLPESTRLAPSIVATRRGPGQMLLIRSLLARAELTDGLTLAQLIVETACRMPRDATVVAIVRQVSDETAAALGHLVRLGFAVTAIVNLFDPYEFSQSAGKLIGQQISVHHLRDAQALPDIGRRMFYG
jgi:uncharacterized protein (DUF58 family)